MRWIVILLLPMVFSCIGTGYTCDRGGIEIHLKVNKDVIDKHFQRAGVLHYGQKWGVKGNISVYYTEIKPVLLYVFDNGIRIQIAIKDYKVFEGLNESCEFWEDPEELDAKEIIVKILNELKNIGAINIENSELQKIANISYWGISGNLWISVENEEIKVTGVKGCGGGGVFILKEWKPGREVEGKNFISIFEKISVFLKKLFTKILDIFRQVF